MWCGVINFGLSGYGDETVEFMMIYTNLQQQIIMSKSEQTINQQIDYEFGSTLSLTSIINSQQTTPRSITRTLLDFFLNQKIPSMEDIQSTSQQKSMSSESDFNQYLSQVGPGLNQIKRRGNRKFQDSIVETQGIQDLGKCYNDIEYLFFREDFVLNMENYGDKQKMKQQQEKLNEFLDLVEINLFTLVNHKFNNFYQALVNFEELEHQVEDNLNRLSLVRVRIPDLKKKFIQKAASVSRIIQLRTNKEATLRHLTLMRSLIKLPPTIKNILQSPLPHQSLSLLSTGKQMYKIVRNIKSLNSIGESLQKSDNVVKHSLYKSFSDKIFLYITSSMNPPYLKYFQSLPVFSAKNPNQSILQEDAAHDNQPDFSTFINSKTQQQLVATIYESYELVDFVGGSKIRSKIVQHIKLITREFFNELQTYLNKDMKMGLLKQTNNEQKHQKSSGRNLSALFDKLSIGCFAKIMTIYQNMFKCAITRLLSTLESIYFKFAQDPKVNLDKAIPIIEQFLYILTSILKIVCDQTSQEMTLKKIQRQTSVYELNVYLIPMISWINYCQSILNSKVIFIQKSLLSGLETKEYKKKILLLIEPLQQNKQKLLDIYFTNFHKDVISIKLKKSLQQQSWIPSDNIPHRFMMILNYIFNKNQTYRNANQSLEGNKNSSFNLSFVEIKNQKDAAQTNHNQQKQDEQLLKKRIYDIKLLKNGIVLDRKIFKTTNSFLLFCEVVQSYLRMQQMFVERSSDMRLRMGDIAIFFSSYSVQLIVGAGALKLSLSGSKSITVKHLCLEWCNLKLLWEVLVAQQYLQLQKAVHQVDSHLKQVINKMSTIILYKVESEVNNLLKEGLGNSSPNLPTLNIINSQKQMMEIMEDYLDEDSIKEVMSKCVNHVLKRYFGYLQGKGERGREQGRYYIQEMRVLEISFQGQIQLMKKIVQL